ncbi:MAG: SDR family NAD(P)-dependent oxidoreductase, partial [Planctomycetaceae bacterium]|nr:SDR family NAD(P)-dependent oxidoreductase [Planctomycetaceae bacterium]
MSNRPLAVVTGASDGMGKEFARQLAAMGNDLLLIARRGYVLDALKDELEKAHSVSVETMPLDLSKLENIELLEKKIQDSDSLLWLVNAAGFGSGSAIFPHVSPDIETQMLTLHTIAPMRLCRAALIPMNVNGRGFIINIASVAAWL